MEIFLARTQGFCAGVSYAIEIVEQALTTFGLPLYVYHEIVHNTTVVEDFRRRGVCFVEGLSEVPAGATLIFSAHGVPPSVREQAQAQGLRIINATCPLVKKVHRDAIRYSQNNYQTILIGHQGHQEVIGTAGYIRPDLLHIVQRVEDIETLTLNPGDRVAYLTQTTLSMDETAAIVNRLRARFPDLIEPAKTDICYATQNRQDAVKDLARFCDIIIICGSANSSNSNRLRETGEQAGVPSYLVDQAADLDLTLLTDKMQVGISSGASVPRSITDARGGAHR